VQATGAGAELAYSEITSNVVVSATTSGTANTVVGPTVSIGFDGSTAVVIEFFTAQLAVAVAQTSLVIELFEDATDLCLLSFQVVDPNLGVGAVRPALRKTPSAGSHTYTIKAWRGGSNNISIGAGAGTGGALAPAFIRIVRV
jgi:hypothetical protein